MKQDKQKTKVLFLIEKIGDGVFAYFPDEIHSFNGYREDNRTCYSHIGQHSACHPDYAKECIEAKPSQYLDLYEELLSIGYNLKVLNKKKLHTIDRIIAPVNGRFGAPMGRISKGERPEKKKVFDCAVPMVYTGDYDKGGAYWGLGNELRVEYTKDLSYIRFYRKGDDVKFKSDIPDSVRMGAL